MADLDLLALVDVESTGLNPTTDEVIELGCILYSLSHNTVLQQVSTLVPVSVDVNPTEHLNGISAGAAGCCGSSDDNSILHAALEMIGEAHAIAAHNAQFDRSFLEKFICDHDYEIHKYSPLGHAPWIDTRAIAWPKATRQGCSLVELALSYGIPVWANHRALTDCQLLAHIIQREPDAARLLARELESKVWATWASTPFDKEGHARAKSAGFRWNDKSCPANGVWSRLMHPDDIQTLPFEVVVMEVSNVA